MIHRDFRILGEVLKTDLETMLSFDPDAFDCLVYRALESERDEVVSCVPDVVGSIESGEKAQSYAPPVLTRARLAPQENLSFGTMSGSMEENFLGASQPMTLLLSLSEVRKYSLIQWLEYPDVESDETITRTVYVLDSRPVGRTLGVDAIYTCAPMPALGEIPATQVGDESLQDADPTPESPASPKPAVSDVVGGY